MSFRNSGPRGPYHKWRFDPFEASPLRKARLKNGHTQAQAAEIIGVSRSQLAQWETGHKPLPTWYGPIKRLRAYIAGQIELFEPSVKAK